MKQNPFFMVGCVRSGTTFLRDTLRHHPNLISPEETHFYRWAEPFGSNGYKTRLKKNKTLIQHRQIDKVEEELFLTILDESKSCRELYDRYMQAYAAANKPEATRWFDKTPQNVYGVGKILRDFPEAKLIQLIRHPLDVAASLKIGRVIKVDNPVGAAHYWSDALATMDLARLSYPDQVLDIRYEDLVGNLPDRLADILSFVGESPDVSYFSKVNANLRGYVHSEILTDDEIRIVGELCGDYAVRYGYSFPRTAAGGSADQLAAEEL